MSICTFFGHKDTEKEIEPLLRSTLISLIENNNIDTFYVGNNGNFDYMVYTILESLSKYYKIKYYIVLAYLPIKKTNSYIELNPNTILPEEIENVPPKYAIDKRNHWMINHSDFVICYVKHHFGGSAKFKEIAENKKKTVINLSNMI